MHTRAHVRKAVEVASVVKTIESTPPADDDIDSLEDEDDCVEEEYGSDHGSEEDADNFHGSAEEPESEETMKKPAKRRKTSEKMSYLRGKNNYKWILEPPESGEIPSVIPQRKERESGAINEAEVVRTPLEAWSLLFNDKMLNIIVKNSNRKIAEKRANVSNPRLDHEDLDVTELKSFIGLLYFSGIHKYGKTSVRNLWDSLSSPLFRATMTENRFTFLLTVIRFDDSRTRHKRRLSDKFAPIRELWNIFIDNCKRFYQPGENCVIGEQLLGFRGKCSFRTFVPSKNDKYGLKVISMNDSLTYYMINAIPHVGTIDPNLMENEESMSGYLIRKLTEPIHHTNRNITCDNPLTSLMIVERMKQNFSLTIVGTIRKNEPEIPDSFKTLSMSENIRFAYNDGKILVSCKKENGKIVLLLSSLHSKGTIDAETKKPEILMFYDKTINGVDTFDQLCQAYSTTRKTNRWPMRFFYGMLDQAVINSQILFTFNKDNQILSPSKYLEDLSLALIKPLLKRRLTHLRLRTLTRLIIESILHPEDIPEERNPRDFLEDNKMEKRSRCGFCPTAQDRKTSFRCLQCTLPMCQEHSSKICYDCVVNKN